jgi:polyphosphate kinase
VAGNDNVPAKLPRQVYERELYRLQGELVKMQGWMRATGARIVVIFEGRDAAGKGGTIKRAAEFLNPRVAPIVALPAPTASVPNYGSTSSSIPRSGP